MKEWFNNNIEGSGLSIFLGLMFLISLGALGIREDYLHKEHMANTHTVKITIDGYITAGKASAIVTTIKGE